MTNERNKTPDFSIKDADSGQYVGCAWLKDSKFGGKYLVAKMNEPVRIGSTLYISPRRDSEAEL